MSVPKWTFAEDAVLRAVMGTSGLLSIAGSCATIYLTMHRQQQQRSTANNNRHVSSTPLSVFLRLMTALGICDIAASTGYFLNIFFSEPGAACTTSGLLTVSGGVAVAFCNASISHYFYLAVVCNRKEFRVPQIVWFSLLLVYPVAIGMLGVAMQAFGPLSYIEACYLTGDEYPPGCSSPDSSQVECIQEERFSLSFLSVIPSAMAATFGFTMTLLVWFNYRATIRKSRTYNFPGNDTENNNNSTNMTEQQRKRLREVTTQAILFGAVFLNTFFWPVLCYLFSRLELQPRRIPFFLLLFVSYALYPLQGLLNLLVYIRPDYKKWRQELPANSSPWEILVKCFTATSTTTRTTTNTGSNHHTTGNNRQHASSRFLTVPPAAPLEEASSSPPRHLWKRPEKRLSTPLFSSLTSAAGLVGSNNNDQVLLRGGGGGEEQEETTTTAAIPVDGDKELHILPKQGVEERTQLEPVMIEPPADVSQIGSHRE